MDIRVVVGDVTKFRGDAVVVNLFEGVRAPGGATAAVDAALGGTIRKLIQVNEVTGKWGEQTLVHALGKLPVDRVLVMGLGKREDFTLDRVRIVSAEAVKHLRKIGARRVGTIVHGAGAAAPRGHPPGCRRLQRRAGRPGAFRGGAPGPVSIHPIQAGQW